MRSVVAFDAPTWSPPDLTVIDTNVLAEALLQDEPLGAGLEVPHEAADLAVSRRVPAARQRPQLEHRDDVARACRPDHDAAGAA